MSYQPVLYCTHRPGPPLDRFVEQLWYWEGVPLAHAKDLLLPNGQCGLIINLFEFFSSFLVEFLLFLGIALFSMAIVMIQHL